jgi:hypothetical protein
MLYAEKMRQSGMTIWLELPKPQYWVQCVPDSDYNDERKCNIINVLSYEAFWLQDVIIAILNPLQKGVV